MGNQNYYLRYFKSDFDAVKSKFGLLIEQIEEKTSEMKTTSKMKGTNKSEDDLRNGDAIKNED